LEFLEPRAVDDKRNEIALLSSQHDINWVIARPTRLLGDALTKNYQANLERPRKLWVSRANVADFLLNQVEHTDWINQAPFVP